ncbi:hypothetical protein P4U43_12015 [Arthrobacter sp. EH-1B-1]|uniref:GPI inositol-deacylase PGAP1-like alpha/beta domain-containing protein n=1 Tax=Arthrobacter vasquezii TaxID=2977629 RepID=A0ABT6CWX9_9MICC|nr:hypothetical protein [Arthrobacter vasquezii]MDF9278514.1 hypothetical protein [Arthrobacter vasquezii]
MSQLLGMDPGQVRQLARSLENAAAHFELVGLQVSGKLSVIGWQGGDADYFRADWAGRHRPTLLGIAEQLRQAALEVVGHADAQEGTSATGAVGPPAPSAAQPLASSTRETSGDDNGNWITDGLEWVAGGADWVVDTTADGAEWFGNRAELGYGNIAESFRDLVDGGIHAGGLFDEMLAGSPPSIMELSASVALAGSSLVDFTVTAGTFGQWAPLLLDDGTPWAGEPIPVSVSRDGMNRGPSQHLDSVVPTDLAALAFLTAQAYGDASNPSTADGAVRITRVENAEGPAYILSIPGTQSWNPVTSAISADLTGNLVSASGQMSTAAATVALAMERAGIEPGAPVMLSGHSQGGMIAASLASDPVFLERYNVTNVMTFGSPVDGTAMPSNVDVISFQHQNDVVSRLDLGGTSVNGAVPEQSGEQVTLPDPPGSGWSDVAANHDYNNYAHSISEAEDDPANRAFQYAQSPSTQRFLTGDTSAVESFVIPVGRRQQ